MILSSFSDKTILDDDNDDNAIFDDDDDDDNVGDDDDDIIILRMIILYCFVCQLVESSFVGHFIRQIHRLFVWIIPFCLDTDSTFFA